ncbi:zinc-dependent alcohol dehydrogenase [Deinococcus peraridilitoris]|uniref:Theronine dehydrogenase-like Zn-dependent dehydrogenase n=1 Tax=Deinococcus peraridilitoris (strain DSM 19664 / LMG 22246 / CIP 109416 / KR-200) TaxID=937777 RepID=K9ZZH8_DEIPD|nr:alcohol dehydrogenase catalytic domain-containing protein [Deinococcus peraridilitoris]AFZ66342.1 theronine dehydrogenase-like Zn-dependent dehydrogenase [Deinococcus peraridilitoris DSM 19664]
MTHAAAVLTGKERFALTERTLSTPSTGEVVIEIRTVGVCGSDIHMFHDGRIGNISISEPLVLGHEFMGVVTHAPDGARDGDGQPLRPGNRVAVEPHVACGHCRECREGHPNLCTDHTFMGVFPRDGALQQKLIVPAHNCFVLPDGISDIGGAMLEPLGVALHALRLGHVTVGDRAAVVGAGPIGLLLVQLLRLAGVTALHVIEPLAWRRELAATTGATSVAAAFDTTEDSRYDVVFEAGWADDSVQTSALLARPGAKVVLVGIPGDDRCTVQHSLARRKGLSLIFSRRMAHTYPECIALVERGMVDVDKLVSDVFPLDQVQRAFERHARYEEGVVKVMVQL